MSTEISILQLPAEVLTEIFLHLELPDRKRIRLCCRLFYDACNRTSVISRAKFVLRTGYCIQEITKTVLLWHYFKRNQEVQGLPLNEIEMPDQIWTYCGDQTFSLSFDYDGHEIVRLEFRDHALILPIKSYSLISKRLLSKRSSKMSVLKLMPEILSKIFLHLELPDRRSVRLTCRSFYEACNCVPIIRQEKFVIRREYCIEDIFKTLLLCRYLRLNIEFCGLQLDLLPGKVWVADHFKMYSLRFRENSVDDKTGSQEIRTCTEEFSYNISTKISILQLPPEILTKVFLYLELPDRKNVRLSCQSFYNACNQISIISQEKIVIRRKVDVQDMTQTLLSCQYLRLDLEFEEHSLDQLPGKIWSHCGDKIYSLTFPWVSVEDEIVKNVITHCQNLKHLEVWVCSREAYYSPQWMAEGVVKLMKTFEELVKQKIIHNQLECLTVYVDFNCKSDPSEVFIDDKSIWDSIIESIFVIFPKLKTLGTLCSCSNNPPNYSVTSTSICPIFPFTPVDECYIPVNVERLLIGIPSDGDWLKNSSLWNLRLKEIQASLYYADKVLEILLNFFSHQKLLEVICLTVCHTSSKSSKILLLHIIKVCPYLRRLSLNYSYPNAHVIELSDYEFSLLLKQRLEFLKLRFIFNDSLPDGIKKTVKLPVNKNLHTLIIDSLVSLEDDYLSILQYFQNLKHLDLCRITDAVLQAIIKNHVNLEILKLNHVDKCTDFGFTGRNGNKDPSQPVYSIRRLKNLQFLDINCANSREFAGFTGATFLEFVFPKLKHFRYLNLDGDSAEFAKNFKNIADNAPLLEVLILDVKDLIVDQLIEVCRNLKNLYYFESGLTRIQDTDCPKLFLSGPSLRFIAGNEDVCCWNQFTKIISFDFPRNIRFSRKDFKWYAEFSKV